MATGSYEESPADERHLGSSRIVGFHALATTVILAVSGILRPALSSRKEDARRIPRRWEKREGEPGEGDRGVRGSVASVRRGKITPTLMPQAVRHQGHEGYAFYDDPPKRPSDVVKRPGPRYDRSEP
jgi:hypothetical protein